MGISGAVVDTLALLQQRQMRIDAMVKEDRQVAAARSVRKFARGHEWPEEDVAEVLAALGLTHHDEENHEQAGLPMDRDDSGSSSSRSTAPRRPQRSNKS